MNVNFANRVLKYLRPQLLKDFEPAPIAGYNEKPSQTIDTAAVVHFRIQGRTVYNAPILILDMKHEVIVGKKYLEYHDVLVDSRRKRLLFPGDWHTECPSKEIAMDKSGDLLWQPEYQQDMERHDKAIEQDEKQRTDGRKSNKTVRFALPEVQEDPSLLAIKSRIIELEQPPTTNSSKR